MNKWNIPVESQVLKMQEYNNNDMQSKKEYAPRYNNNKKETTLYNDNTLLKTFHDQTVIKLTTIDVNDEMSDSDSFTIKNQAVEDVETAANSPKTKKINEC